MVLRLTLSPKICGMLGQIGSLENIVDVIRIQRGERSEIRSISSLVPLSITWDARAARFFAPNDMDTLLAPTMRVQAWYRTISQ